jgi:hypothetical protein
MTTSTLPDAPTVCPNSVKDPVLEEHHAEHLKHTGGQSLHLIPCKDPDRHETLVEGMRIYLARVRAGLTREQLEDRLLDEGFLYAATDVATWEHGAEDDGIDGRVLNALPRLLGVRRADLVLCYSCSREAAPQHFTPIETDPHEPTFSGRRLVEARQALGLSLGVAAQLAEIEPRTAELIERGKARVVRIDELGRYMEAVGLHSTDLCSLFELAQHHVGATVAA